ncbi:MAG TPA: hypothetical protein VMG99_03285, partial [Thermoplasmata archaeon]|nr:hypothetical protein [Thermoplasmata archaeon]
MLCVLVLLTTSVDPSSSTAREGSSASSHLSTDLTNPAPAPEYPYSVAPSMYPFPSNLTPSTAPTGVRIVASATGDDYLLFANDSSKELWLATGGYSAADAAAEYTGSPCISGSGPSCVAARSVYLTWDTPLNIVAPLPCESTCPVITADSLAEMGSTLVVGFTTFEEEDGSPVVETAIESTTNGGDSMTYRGDLSGTLTDLAAGPENPVATTISSDALYATQLTLSGLGPPAGGYTSVELAPSGVQNASVSSVLTAQGMATVVVASEPGSGTVVAWVSSNGGESFGAPTTIAALNTSAPSSVLDQMGDTMLYPAGGSVGQVAATSVGGSLFVLYTNRVDGRVVAEDVVSPNGGADWAGPYPAFPSSGSVQDPAVAPEPDGDLLATWRDNGNGSWQVDQAVYSANGSLLEPVGALPDSGGDASVGYSAGPPAVAVDWLGRPLYAWTDASSPGGPAIEYSGDFLSANRSLANLDHLLTDPLVPGDFSPATSGAETSFNTSTGSAVSATTTDLSKGGDSALEAAQNETLSTTIPAVTRVAVSTSEGSSPTSTSELAGATGVASPNIYLAVAAAQLLNALGVAVTASPLALVPTLGGSANAVPVATVSTGGSIDSESWSVAVTPTPLNPSTAELSTTPGFPEYVDNVGYQCIDGDLKSGLTYTYYSLPVAWWSNVSVDGGSPVHFASSSALPSVFLTNLTPYTHYSWSGTYTATYREYLHEYSLVCGINTTMPESPDTLGPASISGSLSGSTATTLGVNVTPSSPSGATFLAGKWVSGSRSPPTLTAYWNNTMLAEDALWLNESGGASTKWSSSAYVIADVSTAFTGLPTGSYTATVVARSEAGSSSSSDRPAISFGNTVTQPAQVASVSCSFTLTPPSISFVSGPTATQVSTSTEEVQWAASATGLGEMTYYEFGTGLNFTISGIPGVEVTEGFSSTQWNYSVVLHGLDDFAVYDYSVGVGVGSGCIQKSMWSSEHSFETPHVLGLTEWDDAYDSITETGGGASISWEMPTSLERSAEFQNGVLFWQNRSSTVEVPLTNTSEFESTPTSSVGILHGVTLPQTNTSYTVWVDLNYTLGGRAMNVTSTAVEFEYLADSSGDGLTNLEKGLGWTVTTTTASGATANERVTADPADYATNGLVSDYVEKEYDLDPNTVDTAGSHLLDTWNLTFDLGPVATARLPTSGFEYWYENSHNPFAALPGGVANGTDRTNLTPTPRAGLRSGDGSPWAATVLWSESALGAFENLSGVKAALASDGWLRAVTGEYDGDRTLTVWGKLSWGANPLAASTPDDGIADGARVDPLYDVGLEFHSVYANLSDEGGGTGYAVRMFDNYTNDAGRAIQVDNWSTQAIVGTPPNATVNDYNTTLPATQTQQNQSVSLEVSEDLSGWPQPAHLDSGNELEYNVTYDLVGGSPIEVDLPGGGSGGTSTLYGVFEEVPLGVKAPTWLWVPTDNSTVSRLPTG